jgi:hypothetical protein
MAPRRLVCQHIHNLCHQSALPTTSLHAISHLPANHSANDDVWTGRQRTEVHKTAQRSLFGGSVCIALWHRHHRRRVETFFSWRFSDEKTGIDWRCGIFVLGNDRYRGSFENRRELVVNRSSEDERYSAPQPSPPRSRVLQHEWLFRQHLLHASRRMRASKLQSGRWRLHLPWRCAWDDR